MPSQEGGVRSQVTPQVHIVLLLSSCSFYSPSGLCQARDSGAVELGAIPRLPEGSGSEQVSGRDPKTHLPASECRASRTRQSVPAATKPVGAFKGSLLYWVGLGLLQTGGGQQSEPRDRDHRTEQLDQLQPGLPRAQQH